MNSERRLDDLLYDAAETNYLRGVVCEVNGRYLCGTPLHIFATRGDIEACKILLEAGADVDVEDGDGYTQLHCAVEQGHTDTVRLLLDYGSNQSLTTPLGATEDLAEDFPAILELIRTCKHAEQDGGGQPATRPESK